MSSTKIAEIQLRIFQASEAIEKARKLVASAKAKTEKRAAKEDVEKLLGIIARLQHEKSRLAMRGERMG